MKKNFLFMAALLLGSSCSSDFESPQSAKTGSGRAIAFRTTWADKQTRAATTANEITDFVVAAWQTAPTAASRTGALIDGLTVTKSGSDWTYTPVGYWPMDNSTVSFYAYTPYKAATDAHIVSGKDLKDAVTTPSITYLLPGHSTNTALPLADQEDFLVSKHNKAYLSSAGGSVTINFRHALSRVLIQAKCEEAGQSFEVLSVVLKNIKNSGTLDLSTIPADATAIPYAAPTDAAQSNCTYWNTTAGTDGDLAADLGTGVTVDATDYVDIVGDNKALYVIPQQNATSNLTKPTIDDGTTSPLSNIFYIEIKYKKTGQTDAEAVTFAIPIPAQVGNPTTASMTFEMERQYTFQFELVDVDNLTGPTAPDAHPEIKFAGITASAYDTPDGTGLPVTMKFIWAGSNIYYDAVLKHLTFDDYDDDTHAEYQGVFFQWGSLTGISPVGAATAYDPAATITYPQGGEVVTPSPAWGAIPYTSVPASTNAPLLSYLANTITTTANTNAGRGDICRYLSDKGWAPVGRHWRMPTQSEFGAAANYSRKPAIPVNAAFAETTVDASKTDGSLLITTGYTKYGVANAPFLPASGYRNNGGTLNNVGVAGYYWSGSPYSVWIYGIGDTYSAYNLYFLGNSVQPSNGNTPPYAYPIRCVAEY